MMQHQIVVQAHLRPETLERVLRVVRHRGFTLRAINMKTSRQANSINIKLTVESTRPLTLLCGQLTRLVDVDCVEIRQQTSQQIRA